MRDGTLAMLFLKARSLQRHEMTVAAMVGLDWRSSAEYSLDSGAR